MRDRHIRTCVLAFALLLGTMALSKAQPPASGSSKDGAVQRKPGATETWLCPVCQIERIQRPQGATTLTCPRCRVTLGTEDLRIPVAYICLRTRPTQTVWTLMPECEIFRTDGLRAIDKGIRPIWIPWSAVDYYIPRQRILRLTSGVEFLTPYAKSTEECPDPPLLIATIADSVGDYLHGRSLRTETREEDLATAFIVARSPTARDSARVRFISEVESGKHPRLPRTQPTALRVSTPTVPSSAAQDSAEVVLEVRISDRGGVLKVNRIQGSGNPEIDQAALLAAYRSGIVYGGEMGVGVPCSMILRFHFNHGTATGEAEPAKPPMWREWVEPPQ